MEEIHSKLQNVVISEVNSNHIIDNSHSVKKLKKKDSETDHENQMNHNGAGSATPPSDPSNQTSSDNEVSTELSELAQKIPIQTQCTGQELETIEMVRDNETFRITYKVYESELELPSIMKLIQKDLSEPYSIYTYRYFIHNWPKLCYLALYENKCVGCIVCKLDVHRQMIKRGYIAMLAVDKDYRKLKIGTTLVQKAIRVMIANRADEVVLETEITNQPALKLYENLGFVRDKRLFHYYLNGVDALRLKVSYNKNSETPKIYSNSFVLALVQMNGLGKTTH
jgi:N-alpha-acetyltransferase 30